MPKKDIYWHLIVNEKYFPLQIEQYLKALCFSGMWAEENNGCYIFIMFIQKNA